MPTNAFNGFSAIRPQLAFLAAELRRVSVVIVLFSLLAVCLLIRYLKSPWRSLPPGPSGYPIIGNAVEVLDKKRFFAKCRSYGQPAVILNSQRSAADLLDRRAVHFSGRPRLISAHELLGGRMIFSTEGHNARWRRVRRAVQEAFRPSAAERYHALEAKEAARLAGALTADTPAALQGNHSRHFVHYVASTVLAITYDRAVRSAEDEAIVVEVEHIAKVFAGATMTGAYLVDLFPWMLFIPGRHVKIMFAKWKRDAVAWHAHTSHFLGDLIGEVKGRMMKEANEEARPCLVRTLVEEGERFGLSDAEKSWAAGTMYIAGTETQAITLEWFTLAMIGHPGVQQRAQAELDAVIGRARPPRVGDRDRLPYLAALLREVLRWRPAVPRGLPHLSEQDDWYKGYFIPKGTVCIVNMLACHSDSEIYGEFPDRFDPGRYLDENGQLKPPPADTKDEGHIAYGFGRRICAGRHVANDTLFMAMATVLWACDVQAGGAFDLDGYIDNGSTISPKPFISKFKPRFAEAMTILKEEIESC
ncbi:cytochrome P450 [Vararia minispora EC-137]|uniref:Cytochrome P450 n=1 Tax=Vararia minispora EC-137 TaxID=1314806 RepID=A0ACB8Q7U6_9AGAM|nr:cytochrome P450 [Vararia minispora EC-137]